MGVSETDQREKIKDSTLSRSVCNSCLQGHHKERALSLLRFQAAVSLASEISSYRIKQKILHELRIMV